MKDYDVILIGAGASGIFAAHEVYETTVRTPDSRPRRRTGDRKSATVRRRRGAFLRRLQALQHYERVWRCGNAF